MWGLMCVEGFLSVGFKYMCRTGKQGRDRLVRDLIGYMYRTGGQGWVRT